MRFNHFFVFLWVLLTGFLVYKPGTEALPRFTWSNGNEIKLPENLNEVMNWRGIPARKWAGPDFWCNRLQDWEVRDGYLHAGTSGDNPCRTAHLLTYELTENKAPFKMQAIIGVEGDAKENSFAGFLIGAGEGRLDYRGSALIHHLPGKGGGILAVLETDNNGRVCFRDMSTESFTATYPLLKDQVSKSHGRVNYENTFILLLEGFPVENDNEDFTLRLSLWNSSDSSLIKSSEIPGICRSRLIGNIALVSHSGSGMLTHRFQELKIGEGRIINHPERAFGPIAGTLYTVSDKTLKLSAQFTHLGDSVFIPAEFGSGPDESPDYRDGKRYTAHLEEKGENGKWNIIDGPKTITGPHYSVLFRSENWDDSRERDVRVSFMDYDGKNYFYNTHITANPIDKPVVSIAAFSCMGVLGRTPSSRGPVPGPDEEVIGRFAPANIWAPFEDAVRAVKQQDVDILFFTGDQIYEFKPSPTDQSAEPNEDYLYKWLIWVKSFRELTGRLPAVLQTDDHDVYHGNLWGWSGRVNTTGFDRDGGYIRAPSFVNLVHRTQTSHLPDPYDPGGSLNEITNYYTLYNWGEVGFAILEDRKFKVPRHVTDPAEQELLGPGQLKMIKDWGYDWKDQQFKCIISQTIYATMNVNAQGLIPMDYDPNGFPKGKRDEFLDIVRRFGALIVSGDQHLPSFARLGIEKPSDAVYQFAGPALGNIFWRWFYPAHPGNNPKPGAPSYTGEFTDQFGNYFNMIAVANPERKSVFEQNFINQRYLIPREEAVLGVGDYIRTSQNEGYGIVRFVKDPKQIIIECWPYNPVLDSENGQFDGWPVYLEYSDLDGREPVAWLPDIEITGKQGAVIKIINQTSGELEKSTRVNDTRYSPGIFDPESLYTLRIGVPENGLWKEVQDLRPSLTKGEKIIRFTE
jgi:alkaline phosphatase D